MVMVTIYEVPDQLEGEPKLGGAAAPARQRLREPGAERQLDRVELPLTGSPTTLPLNAPGRTNDATCSGRASFLQSGASGCACSRC